MSSKAIRVIARSTRKHKRSRNTGANQSSSSHPGQFMSSFYVAKTFRFEFNAAGTASVSNGSPTSPGPANCLVMGTSSTTIASLFQAFKIRRIRVWGPPAQNLVPVTVSLTWGGGTTGFATSGQPQRTISDTSTGATRVAFVDSKPPRNSPASFWQRPTTANQFVLFEITAPINTIVDVHMVLQQDMNADATPSTNNITGPATVGDVYGYFIESADLMTPVGVKVIS